MHHKFPEQRDVDEDGCATATLLATTPTGGQR